MLRKFHKTTSERGQRTSGTYKGSLLSSKGGRTKYKREKEKKEVGMEIHPAKGVLKEETFRNTRKHSHWRVCGEPRNLRGQYNREEEKYIHT